MNVPYVSINQSAENVTGLLPELIKPAIDSCCGNCTNGHGASSIDFNQDGHGNYSQRENITEFIKYDEGDTDLLFPVKGFSGI